MDRKVSWSTLSGSWARISSASSWVLPVSAMLSMPWLAVSPSSQKPMSELCTEATSGLRERKLHAVAPLAKGVGALCYRP